MCTKQAVIVIRHGQKGYHGQNERVKDPEEYGYKIHLSNPDDIDKLPEEDKAYYEDTLNDLSGGSEKVVIDNVTLSKIGYQEGRSFEITIPKLIMEQGLADIVCAYILNPSNNNSKEDGNGNTYVTAYKLVKELSKDDSFQLHLYPNAEWLEGKLDVKNYSGSILVAGTAETLWKKESSPNPILHQLHKIYSDQGKTLERGRDIFVYSHKSGFEKYVQVPENNPPDYHND